MKKELDENVNVGKYSPMVGYPELKKYCALEIEKKHGVKVDPVREIYVTVGAMEGVATAVLTTVSAGQECIILSPTFSSHI